jgi:hypothetical protein
MRDHLAAGAPGYEGATLAQIILLHTLLCRLFQLPDNATCEEINRAMIAFDRGGATLAALSAPGARDKTGEILERLRRLFRLSADATLEDIAAALDALLGSPELQALSAALPLNGADRAKIQRLCGVSDEAFRKCGS